MRTIIASDPDREKVFAEIYSGNEQWAEVTQEHGPLLLTIFSPRPANHLFNSLLTIFSNPTGDSWTFPLDEVLDVLHEAKERLVGGRP